MSSLFTQAVVSAGIILLSVILLLVRLPPWCLKLMMWRPVRWMTDASALVGCTVLFFMWSKSMLSMLTGGVLGIMISIALEANARWKLAERVMKWTRTRGIDRIALAEVQAESIKMKIRLRKRRHKLERQVLGLSRVIASVTE